MKRIEILSAVVAAGMMLGSPLMQAQQGGRWVATWATAPMSQDNAKTKPGDLMLGGEDVTVREALRTSIAGESFRVELTNEFSSVPLNIGEVEAGLSTGPGSDAVKGLHPVTFGGKAAVTIPAGSIAVSDPIAMPLGAQSRVSISIYVPMQPMATLSYHGSAFMTNFVAKGNQSSAASLDAPRKMTSWYLLKAVDVQTSAKNAAAIVAFGDSITDGAHSTVDMNHTWPDFLADRLQAGAKTKNLSVLNVGIGGNRVLHDGTGPSALARFDHDVLALDGVKYLMILESINDIGGNMRKSNTVTADDLIWGLTQMVVRAHAHGIKVIAATLTPYGKAGYSYPPGQAMVEAVNNWIRTGGVVDGYVDFYKATQDPANPTQFLPSNDSGDHLHPSDAGYKAMGDSIDLNLFK